MQSERLYDLLSTSGNGVITTADVTNAGINRSLLRELVKSGEIYKVSHGLYLKNDAWEDDFYILQKKYGRGIFSNETALYLHGMSDRTPVKYTMTFPHGYNNATLRKEMVIFKTSVKDNYSLGIVEINSPCNNPIMVYDIERTLCDIVKGGGIDIQLVNEAMKRYAKMNGRDIHKLMKYARQLRVESKILRYMEVLL